MGDVETGIQVAVDGLVPIRRQQIGKFREYLRIAHLGHARVVDQDVDAAEISAYFFGQLLDLGTGPSDRLYRPGPVVPADQ